MTIEQEFTTGYGDKHSGQFPPPTSRSHEQTLRLPKPESEVRLGKTELSSEKALEPLSRNPSERKAQIWQEAQRIFPKDRVAADLLTTQALHESHPHLQNMSQTAKEKNNLLGIRGKKGYAAFPSWQASMESYAHILERNFPRALGQESFEKAAWALQHGRNGRRYATDPLYQRKIKKMYQTQVKPMKDRFAEQESDPAYSRRAKNRPPSPEVTQKGQYHVLKGKSPILGAEKLAVNEWGQDFPIKQMPRVQSPKPRRIKGPAEEL
ncbi:MAG: glucosaminidase domain-containing protein [Bdellovibrionales bacterium]